MTPQTMRPSEEALQDILEEFKMWGTTFSPEGSAALQAIFNGSLGRYLNKLEETNPGRELWSARDLRELSTFILGYVVAEIAAGLKLLVKEGHSADKDAVERVAPNVMAAARTVIYCEVIVKRYQSKLERPYDPTPICFAQRM